MRRHLFLSTMLVLGLAALHGCATPEYIPTLHYAITPVLDVPEAEGSESCLAVRALESAPAYRQHVLFRRDDVVLEAYPNAKWAEDPHEAVTRAIMDALIASKRFKDVADAADFPVPTLLLTGKLRRFEELRNAGTRNAFCEVRLELRQAKDRSLLWARTLSAKVPVADPSVEGLARAMSQAVAQIAQQTAQEVAAF